MLGRVLRLGLSLSAAIGLFAFATPARASHPLVDEGIARYEEADFGRALDVFARAEGSDDLTRADLIALLETRALVWFARADVTAMERDLATLATLEPRHRFPAHAPPDVSQTFERVRSSVTPVRIEASARRRAHTVVLRAATRGGARGIVRAVRIHHRVGASAWETSDDGEVRVRASGRVSYHVEAIGPGGVVIAHTGTARSPRIVAEPATSAPSRGPARRDERSAFPVWPVVAGIAGAAAVATVVAIVVVAGAEQSLDRPSAPMIE